MINREYYKGNIRGKLNYPMLTILLLILVIPVFSYSNIKACTQSRREYHGPKVNPTSIFASELKIDDSKSKNHSSLWKIHSMMFFYYTTLGSTLPYLPVYFKNLGISGQ